MTTVKTVFELAMILIDEIPTNGVFDADKTVDYKTKTPYLLTMLQSELLEKGTSVTPLTTLDDELVLDDITCLTALPNGLASQLLLNDNPDVASYFNDRFEELKTKSRKIATPIAITDVYDSKLTY